MKSKVTKSVSWIIITFTLIIFMTNYLSIRNELIKKNNENLKIKNQFYNRNNKLFNETKHLNNSVFIINKMLLDEFNAVNNKFFLVPLFGDDRFCSNCLIKEVKEIKKLINEYPTLIKIVIASKDNKVINEFSNNKYYEIPDSNLFNYGLNLSKPSILLVDRKGLIYSIYQAEEFNNSKREVFFEKVRRLFGFLE